MTWFRLGGRGRLLFRPRDVKQLACLVSRARREDVPVKFLGGGANVLIQDDGLDGVVVRLDQPAFRKVVHRKTAVEVGAGADLMPFTRACSRKGLSGVEPMAGIPGTVGGAVFMNAGGRSGAFGDVVKRVNLLNPDGDLETWDHEQIGFGYRTTKLGDRKVLSAELELTSDDPAAVHRNYMRHLEEKQQCQPLTDKSAGCIFKNPSGGSAGALIDRAGLKGARVGGARVSRRHANFIVAEADTTTTQVLRLIDLVRDRVRTVFGTELETEIDIW